MDLLFQKSHMDLLFQKSLNTKVWTNAFESLSRTTGVQLAKEFWIITQQQNHGPPLLWIKMKNLPFKRKDVGLPEAKTSRTS